MKKQSLPIDNTEYDVVGVGICAADYICLVPEYPGGNEKTTAEQFVRQGGAPVPTALCVAAKWGARAAFIGAAGDDADGPFVADELRGFGVDVSRLALRRGARTPKAFIWVDKSNGHRAIVLDRTGMPPLRPADIRPLPRCKILHTDGRDTDACLVAMKSARRTGASVMLDAGSPRPRMDEIIAETDVFIGSRHFVQSMFGKLKPEAACRKIMSMGPTLAMITLGSRGCVGATKDGFFRADAHRRENFILDTTGAGDVFHGAFLFGMLRGWDPLRCAKTASAAAFLKCGELGGRAGIPTLAAARRLAAENP